MYVYIYLRTRLCLFIYIHACIIEEIQVKSHCENYVLYVKQVTLVELLTESKISCSHVYDWVRTRYLYISNLYYDFGLQLTCDTSM